MFPHLLAALRLTLAALAFLIAGPALAQSVPIPNYWDPRVRAERPEPGPPRVLRVLTDDEYPPLHFGTPEGGLTGLSVELARAACEKLALTCTVQARRFDTLLDALAEGRGDVLAAAISSTTALRRRFAVTHIYHRSPARFATTRGNAAAAIDTVALGGKRVAVIAGSAHAAFLERLMPFVQRRDAADLAACLAMLRSGEAEYVFADGVALAVAASGAGAGDLTLAGGPYLESAYFGEGVGFLLRKEDAALARAFDYALQALWEDGTYARLYLRFFPVSPY